MAEFAITSFVTCCTDFVKSRGRNQSLNHQGKLSHKPTLLTVSNWPKLAELWLEDMKMLPKE